MAFPRLLAQGLSKGGARQLDPPEGLHHVVGRNPVVNKVVGDAGESTEPVHLVALLPSGGARAVGLREARPRICLVGPRVNSEGKGD